MNYKFYMIKCYTTNKVYIGSTQKNSIKERLAGHLADYKRGQNNNHYLYSSRYVLENNNYDIELLCEMDLNNDTEKLLIEESLINYYSINCVNKVKPFTSKYSKVINKMKVKCKKCNKSYSYAYVNKHRCKYNINEEIENVENELEEIQI